MNAELKKYTEGLIYKRTMQMAGQKRQARQQQSSSAAQTRKNARPATHLWNEDQRSTLAPQTAAQPQVSAVSTAYAVWLTASESSGENWTLDAVRLHNNREHLFYQGQPDGNFVWLHPDGLVEIGTYTGAFPYITDADFQLRWSMKFGSFAQAAHYVQTRARIPFITYYFSTADWERLTRP